MQKRESRLREVDYKVEQLTDLITNTQGGVTIPPEAKHLVPFGLPSTENVHFHKGYVSAYDRRNRTASWSCEHLSPQPVEDEVTRNRSLFKEDESVPEIYRAKLSDYFKSGYDRGHLTPAGDVKFSQEAMDETFLLSNICPQVGNGFNRHYWARLEKFARDLTLDYDDVYICSGPLYLPSQEEDGKYYVKYQVIGDPPNVSVPTHFFKTVLVTHPKSGTTDTGGVDDPDIVRVASFILPNARINSNLPLDHFLVTTEQLNRASGLSFWNRVLDPLPLCIEPDSCKLPRPDWWSHSEVPDFPIDETIENFIKSEETVYQFPANLSSSQRGQVHSKARDAGLLHFSEGSGKERCVVIQKSTSEPILIIEESVPSEIESIKE